MNTDTSSSDSQSSPPKPVITRCVADFLGLGFLSDDEPGMDPSIPRALYRHARGEDGKRQLFEGDATFKKGWINLSSPVAEGIITNFVPLDDASNILYARGAAAANLDALAWNDLLGIESPPIRCRIMVRGKKWGLRFQSGEQTMKGREIVNEALPPIPDDLPGDTASNGTGPAETPKSKTTPNSDPPTDSAAPTDAAEDVLRKAGLPA